MNRIFRLIWNPRLAMYVPAPESGRGRGKGCGCRCALGALVLSTLPFTAHALPMGGQVSAGQGSIGQSAGAMTVTQQSSRLAINWQSFGIGAAESVNFAQPGASAIALNRVLGADPSRIRGQLSANGQVWLLNPNGVLFGGGAQVNVGGLVASTLNISDADFLAGKGTFAGTGGFVANQGTISAADVGYIALLGGKVSNEGVIQARLGTVALGAGNQITLDFAGDKLLSLQVDHASLDALVQNKQLIQADGGTVLLSTRAANDLLHTVVNNTGVIEARTIDSHSGTIKLLGGMQAGSVRVGGTLDASAPNGGDGGFIETSGAQVKVSDAAHLTTTAPGGKTGQWLIAEPGDIMITPGAGGLSGATLASQLATTNVTVLAKGGSGTGDVRVDGEIGWNSANSLTLSAYGSVMVARPISNSGTGSVNLRADNAGACVSGAQSCTTISFMREGSISANGGAVNLYYNPAGSNNAANANGNGPSYASPTDYSGYVTLNGGSALNAWMLVNDVNQLQAMNTNLPGYYALGRNVDAAETAGWSAGAGFVPVGTGDNYGFSGQFDGLGHTISALAINRPLSWYIGLFGRNVGQIRNVGVVAAAVDGASAVGALVGFNYGIVSDSFSTGAVKSHYGDSYSGSGAVGGLVGINNAIVTGLFSPGGTVSNSYSTAAVDGYYSVGGLVGFNSGAVSNSHSTGPVKGQYGTYRGVVGGLVGFNASGTVSNSYTTGAVDGFNTVGGLVGLNGSSNNVTSGTVSNSYSTGTVHGSNLVGGLVGYNVVGASVSDSYSTGAVNASYSLVGGLVGVNGGAISSSYSTGAVSGAGSVGGLVGTNDGTVSNSYWDLTTSGQSTSAGGTGLTDAQMKQKASFTGFDFINIWDINEGVSYPFLRAE